MDLGFLPVRQKPSLDRNSHADPGYSKPDLVTRVINQVTILLFTCNPS